MIILLMAACLVGLLLGAAGMLAIAAATCEHR